MQVLFSENVCENERIGFHSGGRAPEYFACRSANVFDILLNWHNLLRATKLQMNGHALLNTSFNTLHSYSSSWSCGRVLGSHIRGLGFNQQVGQFFNLKNSFAKWQIKKKYLLVSQTSPVNPSGQLHENDAPFDVQVPSFSHGPPSHGSVKLNNNQSRKIKQGTEFPKRLSLIPPPKSVYTRPVSCGLFYVYTTQNG